MEDQLPPIEKQTSGVLRIMSLFVVIQVTVVLFFVAVVAFFTAALSNV
jgi:hypothetical protein